MLFTNCLTWVNFLVSLNLYHNGFRHFNQVSETMFKFIITAAVNFSQVNHTLSMFFFAHCSPFP